MYTDGKKTTPNIGLLAAVDSLCQQGIQNQTINWATDEIHILVNIITMIVFSVVAQVPAVRILAPPRHDPGAGKLTIRCPFTNWNNFNPSMDK